MISEKFENLAPGAFLEQIQELKKSNLIQFVCDFEYEENSESYENNLVIVGRFHHLEKKWKNKKHVEFIELHNQSQIPDIVESIKEKIKHFLFEGLIKKVDVNLDRIINVVGNESFLGGELFKTLSKYFFVKINIEEFISILNQELRKQGVESLSLDFQMKTVLELEEQLKSDKEGIVDKNLNILWIPIINEQSVLHVKLSEGFLKEDIFDLYAIFFRLFNVPSNETKGEVFAIEEPLVVLNETLDIFHSNEAFRRLNVERKWLADLRNGEIISTNNENYLAIVVEELPVKKELKVVLFFQIENHNSEVLAQGNDEELGIICSSIAHELNNPIGGILNAFQLLQVMNDYDSSTVDMFSEMTKSINRAHRLVNLFLGFVKKDITRKENVQVDVTLNQAVDLLRGRMIKEGVFIHLESIFSGTRPAKSFNESILIIIFYILFNESLTAFARETLVKETSQDEKTLFLKTTISKNSISIEYKNISQRVSHPLDSHLLKYLLKSQELKVNEREKEIEFIWA